MPRRKGPSSFFVFPHTHGRSTETVVFVGGDCIEELDLTERLREHHLRHLPPPDRIVVVASEPRRQSVESVVNATDFQAKLPASTRYADTPSLAVVTFDAEGRLNWPAGDGEEIARDYLVRTGLRTIFDRHGGLLKAGPGYHYVNPSGLHTKGFIRTGGVLRHSSEVAFLAFALLPWWPGGTRHIITDTASINSVAYALAEARREFDPDMALPTIDSFSSYAGVDAFDFDRPSVLCLVSASVSGSLVAKLARDYHVPRDRLVTLFYCGPEQKDAKILCDLTSRESGDGGVEAIESHAAEGCPLCGQGSSTIHMHGDEFLPASPQVDELVITQDHQPRWLTPLLNMVLGQKVVRCHANYAGDPATLNDIFFDLRGPIVDPEAVLGARVHERLLSVVPSALERVIHLDDPASEAMAAMIVRGHADRTGIEPDRLLMSHQQFRDDERFERQGGAILVVAGAVATGGLLLDISKALRDSSGRGHIAYAIGVARMIASRDWEQLRSNLQFGLEPGEFPLMTACRAFLPATDYVTGTPWARERATLRGLLDDSDGRAAVEARISAIDAAETEEVLGLEQNVFLRSVVGSDVDPDAGEPLALREGFVFWRGVDRAAHLEPEKHATQAEVYMTIACVLHHLRSPGKRGPALIQHEHNRTVLAPATFARFNDGIIQASILRAALPSELDYSHDPRASAEMKTMLEGFISQRERRGGEAFPEFLLALVEDRLRLCDDHAKQVVDGLASTELSPFLDALSGSYCERVTANEH